MEGILTDLPLTHLNAKLGFPFLSTYHLEKYFESEAIRPYLHRYIRNVLVENPFAVTPCLGEILESPAFDPADVPAHNELDHAAQFICQVTYVDLHYFGRRIFFNHGLSHRTASLRAVFKAFMVFNYLKDRYQREISSIAKDHLEHEWSRMLKERGADQLVLAREITTGA
ncbi:hypothetical protein F5Y11DRAFT_353235 [Daldinia sp. FL1419]|nr:hypothetical protein F5Y11DRAFT_353235 [Daldinia sp. FL1419]